MKASTTRVTKYLAVAGLLYLVCWTSTWIFGPKAVRRDLSKLVAVDVSTAPIEDYTFNDAHPITEPHKKLIEERNPLFVGRDRCWLPCLLSVDIAGGGPGNIQADRYFALGLPGSTRKLHSVFLRHTERLTFQPPAGF